MRVVFKKAICIPEKTGEFRSVMKNSVSSWNLFDTLILIQLAKHYTGFLILMLFSLQVHICARPFPRLAGTRTVTGHAAGKAVYFATFL